MSEVLRALEQVRQDISEGNRETVTQLEPLLDAAVLRIIEQIRQEAAERTRETGAQLERLLDTAAELISAMNLQVSDTMGISDRVEKIRSELAEMNRARRLEEALRDRSGLEGDR